MKGFVSTPYTITRFSEIKRSKYLIWQLVKRDFTVRYKQTALGFLWAVINPTINIMLYTFVFNILVKLPTPEYQAPYAAVLLVGILLWNLFAGSVISVSDSLVNNMGLIKKVYFPRVILSIVSTTISLVDLVIALIIFVPVLLYMGIHFQPLALLVFLPLSLFTALLTAWGAGCFLAIIKVKYKDFHHIVPLLMQTLFYASPIVYTQAVVPDGIRGWYNLNPLVSIIAMGRHALLGNAIPPAWEYCLGISLVIAIAGSVFFLHNERKVVDLE